jgi:hypothetical protein
VIEVVDTGLVYRNPRPELRSRHTWHPTLVRFDDGEWLCTYDIAEADVSLDYRTYGSRSTDDGKTWTAPVRVMADPPGRPTTHSVRIARISDGPNEVVAFGGINYRDDPEGHVINVPTLGYSEMFLITLRSHDRGRTWEPFRRIDPPLEGPAFEICHSIVELRDGRWLAPTSTWMGWNGEAPNGMNAILLVSPDKGRTWPTYITEFDRWDEAKIHWEQSVIQLRDGRLLAVAWVVDRDTGEVDATPYTISEDGRTFGVKGLTGFRGQTTKLVELPDGRILAAYRRNDQPGLWATVARIEGTRWVNESTGPLWQGAESGMTGERSRGEELAQLKFGFPQMVVRPDGDVMLVFWCEEDCIKNIRWLRVRVS